MKEKIPNKHKKKSLFAQTVFKQLFKKKEKGKKKQREREGTSNHKEVNGWIMQ